MNTQWYRVLKCNTDDKLKINSIKNDIDMIALNV